MSELAKRAIVCVPMAATIFGGLGALAALGRPGSTWGVWEIAFVAACGLGGAAAGFFIARHEAAWADAYQAETDAIMAWLEGKGEKPQRTE